MLISKNNLTIQQLRLTTLTKPDVLKPGLIICYISGMDIPLFAKLLHEELINEQEFNNIALQKDKPVSVHWDLRTLLYLGIVLLTTAVGILVYKNIDTIGHGAMLIIIAAVCVTCFGYCIKNSKGYSNKKIESPNIWFDYVLLLGMFIIINFYRIYSI